MMSWLQNLKLRWIVPIGHQEQPLRSRGADGWDRVTTSSLIEFVKILEVTCQRVVCTQTGFVRWEGEFDDWMDAVDVKLDCRYQTMTESGGMGTLSDQGWNRRRMTVEFMNNEGIHGENQVRGRCWTGSRL